MNCTTTLSVKKLENSFPIIHNFNNSIHFFLLKKKKYVRKCFSSVCGNFSQDFSFCHFRNLKFVKL